MDTSATCPWDFSEPQRLLNDIAETTHLEPDRPVLCLVADAAGACQLEGVTTVDLPPRTHWHQASKVLRAAAERLPLPLDVRGAAPASLLLVAPRLGRVVFGPTEEYWLWACRYLNLPRPVFVPEVVLVTEHGWRFFFQKVVGDHPHLIHHDAQRSAS